MENISEEDLPPWFDEQYKLFTKIRQVCLDEKLSKNLGMTKCVIRERDLLFFYQLLLPLCDTPLSEIREEKWILYYY